MNTKIKRIIPILLAIFIFSFSSVIAALADGEEETAAIPAGQSIEEESSAPTPVGGPTTFAFSENLADTITYPDSMAITSLSVGARNAISKYLTGSGLTATTMGQLRALIPITVNAAGMDADAFKVIAQLSPLSLTSVTNLPTGLTLNKGAAPFTNVNTVSTIGGSVTGNGFISVTVLSGSPTINFTGAGTLTINSGSTPTVNGTPSILVNNSNVSFPASGGTTFITQNGTGTITTPKADATITMSAGKVVFSGSVIMTGTIIISSGELHIPNGHSGILTVSGTAKVAITGAKSGTLTMTGGTVWAQNLAGIVTPVTGTLTAGSSTASFHVSAGASFTVATSYTPGITGLPIISGQTGISSGVITNTGTVVIVNNAGIVNHNANAKTTINSNITNVSYAGIPAPSGGGINFVQGTNWTGSIHIGSFTPTPFFFPSNAGASSIGTNATNKTVTINTAALITIGTNKGKISQPNAPSDVYIGTNGAPINDGSGVTDESDITAGNLRIGTNNAHVVYTARLTGASAPSVNNNTGTVDSNSAYLITVATNSGTVNNLTGAGAVTVTTNESGGTVNNKHTTLVTIQDNKGLAQSTALVNSPITISNENTSTGVADNLGTGLFTININKGAANNKSSGSMTVAANTGTGVVTSTGSGTVTVNKNTGTVTAAAAAVGPPPSVASSGNIIVLENDASAIVNLGGTTAGTHIIGTLMGTKNNGRVNVLSVHHNTAIHNSTSAVYDPVLGSAYSLVAADCQVHITAEASPVISGSGYINVTAGAIGPNIDIGVAGMPFFTGTGRPYIKMSGAGVLGIPSVGVEPTRIEGVAGVKTYKLFLGTAFAGSTSGKGSVAASDGGANFIAFKDFDGEIHANGNAATTAIAIPERVKTLHLDGTALNYTEQWAASTAGKKVTMINNGATFEVVYRGTGLAISSFYPNATAGGDTGKTNMPNRTIGVGITEMVVKAATSFKFYSTESAHSPTLHASATTGMELGGSGGNGTFQLTTNTATDELYFGLGTLKNTATTYATLNLTGATSVETFTSYNDNQHIDATSTKFTNVALHNHYPMLSLATDVFNSGGNNIMKMHADSVLNLTIGAAASGSTGYADGSGKAAVNVPIMPKLFRLDVPKVATLIMNGLEADPTIYLTPSTTTDVTFGDGFNATAPVSIKLHGSKSLVDITFSNDHANGLNKTGTLLKVLDLKVPQSHSAPLDNTDAPIDGIASGTIDKLTEVPTITNWTYDPSALATPLTDKKLDLRDNAIPAIGDDFSNTSTKVISGTRTLLSTKLAGATWINQLDVRGNSMVLINLDEAIMKAHLTNLAYVRGNQTTMRFVNLSNCEKIVNEETFTRRGTTDAIIGPDVANTALVNLSVVEYLWLDNLPQLRLTNSPSIDLLYWENNEISEFSMTNPAGTEIINIDLSNNKIKHVNTAAAAQFGSSASAINHSNIRLTGSHFKVGTADDGFLDLSFQKPAASLVSVVMDSFIINDIWMGYNPTLTHISLTNMPNLNDFNLRSITGMDAAVGGCAVPLDTGGALGTPATVTPPALPSGACTQEGVYNIPLLQVPAPPTPTFDTNYPMVGGAIPKPLAGGETAINFNITYLDYSGSVNIPHTVVPSSTGVNDSAFNIINNCLEEVYLNGCTQLAGKVLYLQNNQIKKLEIKDIGSTPIQGIDLSTNKIENFNYDVATGSTIPTTSNMNLQGSTVEESLILSWNPINRINIDGLEIEHIDISNATTAKNTGAGGTHYRIEGEVKIVNSTTLIAVDIEDDHLTKGLNLSNNPALLHIIGTLNASTGISPNVSTADSSMIQGVLNLTKSAAITDLVGNSNISFPGHLITNAILIDTFNENINLKRQNGTGETAVLTTTPTVTLEADRGDLKEINLSNTTGAAPRATLSVDADENVIEIVNTMNPTASNVKMSNTLFGPQAIIRMNFNNIHTFKISQTGQDGYAGLETILLDNNKMKHLEATQMAGLMYLEVDRTIDNTKLYNSFEDGTVTLTASAKLVYFHPGTTVESDRLIDERVIRKNPVEPNEHQWVSNANSTAASIGLAAVYTNTTAAQSKLNGGVNWGYYSRVPIVSFNAIGCTDIESIRIPGNRLTSATLRLDASASNLLYLDVSGAEATDSGTSDSNYLPNPSRTRGFRPAKAGTMYDAASGQIGGAFTLQWPKLQVFRIQNNSITSLQTSKSPQILEILAHNNKISSLEITRLPNLLYLDVERNSLSQITLPIGNMQIFRAGQNRLNAYPNTNQVPSLRQLYLNHNRLGGDYPHLVSNVNLQVLNVAFNNIKSLAGTNLMPSLEEIYAYNNIIEGYHGLYINGSGGGNLKIADFSQNRIITIIDLPDSLVYLDMSYNKFAGELEMKSPIPSGMSRSTSYPVKAHEVYSGHDIEYGQANSFVGTFDIRENQISGLPGKLPAAWLEFAAKSSGRMVYNMIVKYNILDIDIYDITTPKVDGHVPRNTGEQRWLSINPDANIVVQQYMDYESVIGAIEPELRLFHPIKKSYEMPSRVHEYHYWWNKLEYEDMVSPLSNLIRQTGYIPIKVRINGTGWEDVGSINGFVPVPINVIDKRENPNQTTPNAGMAKTYLIDGETGKVTIISADDDDKNYNPNTGAST